MTTRDRTHRIRLVTPADSPAIRSIYAPFVESTPVSFEETPPTDAELAARIESTLETHPWLVCERDGEILGYAKASALRSAAAYRWTVELTVYVAADARRSGVASGLYTSLFDLLALQGYRRAFAAVTVPNPPSVAFHERMGFEEVGVFPQAGYTQGAWRDVRWMARPVSGRGADDECGTDDELEDATRDAGDESAPDPPRPLPEARTDPDWDDALTAGERVLGS